MESLDLSTKENFLFSSMNLFNIVTIGMIEDLEHILYLFFGRWIDYRLTKLKILFKYTWIKTNQKILTSL